MESNENQADVRGILTMAGIGALYVGAFVLVAGAASGWSLVMLPMAAVASGVTLVGLGVATFGTGWVARLVVRVLRRVLFLGG